MFSADGLISSNGGKIVDELVVQVVDHAAHQALHVQKIHQQAGGIELLALDRDPDAVVVAMHVLALALVIAQGVTGGESLFHGNFKHRKISPRRSSSVVKP